jgi:DNA (cytosine-5)-methyltransferase 1
MSKITVTIKKNISKPIIRFIDLCCGIGGFRLGLNDKRFQCVYSADIKPSAIKTYNANFNENHVITDIYDISHLPQFDMLCAGFPCQPFSSAGLKKGFRDKRGGMIFKILELCETYTPEYVLLENVSNLLIHEKGESIKKITEEFGKLGYNVSYRKLCSSNFGLAQKRERVYILCCRSKQLDLDQIVSTNTGVMFRDVVDLTDCTTNIDQKFCDILLEKHKIRSIYGQKIGDKRGGNDNIHSWDLGASGHVTDEEKCLLNTILTERRKKQWAEAKGIKWMDGMPLTEDEISTFYDSKNLRSMLDNLTELTYLKLEHPKDLVGEKRVYNTSAPKGYNICKGKLSFPISKILSPDEKTPTLTATDAVKLGVLLECNIRTLNELELKRLCGFPENFIIPKGINKFDLFGNMATPPVIKVISNLIP